MELVGATLLGLIASVVSGIIIAEIYAWLPRASQGLVNLAVRCLPLDMKERADEEWHAHLNDLPNSGAMLFHAIGCLTTSAYSRRWRRSAMTIKLELELDEDRAAKIDELADQHGVPPDIIFSALAQQSVDIHEGKLAAEATDRTLPQYVRRAKRLRFYLRWIPWIYRIRTIDPD